MLTGCNLRGEHLSSVKLMHTLISFKFKILCLQCTSIIMCQGSRAMSLRQPSPPTQPLTQACTHTSRWDKILTLSATSKARKLMRARAARAFRRIDRS